MTGARATEQRTRPGLDLGPALLFCPADRPDRYVKAAERSDGVILDLEDAVDPSAREEARAAVIASDLDPERTIVRINAHGTADHAADLACLAGTAYRRVMLAKTESPAQVAALAGYDVVALVETAAGVVAAREIATAPGTVALMWGAEDLMVSLGGTSSRYADGRYRDVARHARSAVLLAARAAGAAAVDAVHADIADVDGLTDEARDAVASGFSATACIHPSQVPVVREAFRPPPEEVARARAVLEAARGRAGAFRWEGQMIDGPFLRHAEQVLRRAR